MSTLVDLNVLKKREDDAKKHIRKSSPMLICSADFGILFIAPNKDRVENRIHKIHDRIMCVTRGMFTHGLPLWQGAVNKADVMSMQFSRGDVSTRKLVQETSQIVASCYESLERGPLKVEIVFAGLQDVTEKDYMGYIDFQGRIRTIQKFGFIGSFDPEAYRDSSKETQEQKSLEAANAELNNQWRKDLSPEDIIQTVKQSERLSELLFDSQTSMRIEMAMLDRKEFCNKNFRNIFKRLNS